MHGLPSCAPRELCDRLLRDPLSPRAAEVRQRLLMDRRMEKVWSSIAKAVAKARRERDPLEVQYWFAHVVFDALELPTGLSGMTPGQAKRTGAAIKKKGEELAELLRRIGLVDAQCLSTVELGQLARAIAEELPSEDDPTMLMCSGRPGVPLRMLKENLFPAVLAKRLMQRDLLSFGDVLSRIADWAVRERKFSFLGKPNAKRAGRLYMVFRLSNYCRNELRSPLPQAVAVTTSVALDLDRGLTEEEVKAMTRRLKERLARQ